MRITRAYCIELDDIVTIAAARRAYLSEDPRPARYRFLCSSPDCRAAGVRVTAVAYTVNPAEDTQQVTAHFRENPNQAHLKNCEWVAIEEADEAEPKGLSERDEEAVQRRLRRALVDVVTGFDPSLDEDADANTGEREVIERAVRADGISGRSGVDVDTQRNVRTRDLQRLVDTLLISTEK